MDVSLVRSFIAGLLVGIWEKAMEEDIRAWRLQWDVTNYLLYAIVFLPPVVFLTIKRARFLKEKKAQETYLDSFEDKRPVMRREVAYEDTLREIHARVKAAERKGT